ncbi:hypothetical protein NN6n1_12700 [Shinella zoogloeoides]
MKFTCFAFGLTVGLLIASWLDIAHPFAAFAVGCTLAMPTLWLVARAHTPSNASGTAPSSRNALSGGESQ